MKEKFKLDNLEEALVEKFLNRFVVISETSNFDHVNLFLMLKAIPNEIQDFNLDHMELFNFHLLM